MKHATDLYDALSETFDYVCKDWLRIDITEHTRNDSRVILAAASFLFDNLFAKEDAGKDLTAAVAQELGASFRAADLSTTATTLRLEMAGDEFQMGTSPFRDYIRWVGEVESIVLQGYSDMLGRLAYVTIEALVNLIIEQEKDANPTRVSEYVFLNIVHEYYLAFRTLMGGQFSAQKSAPFFLDVEEQFESIRAQILD